jgi:osmotically inducible protein OsmC
MAAQRRAQIVWHGTLTQGNGTLNVGTGVIKDQPITWAARIERPDGKTSPEELLAAAHAGCYAMALSHTLTQDGTPPEWLEVNAVCTADQSSGGLKITTMDLEVRAKVPGLDAGAFEQEAKKAEQNCPVSNALRNNVQIRVKASLETGQPQAAANK